MTRLTCPKCNGELDISNASGKIFCYHCGSEVSNVTASSRDETEEKLLTLAKTLEDAGSHVEAIEYYNKVLEINPDNYKAWLGKGRTVYFESTLGNPRIGESIKFFQKAHKTAPDEFKDKTAEEIKSVTLVYIESFYIWAKSHYEKFKEVSGTEGEYLDRIKMLLNSVEVIASLPCSIPELLDVALYQEAIDILNDIFIMIKLDPQANMRNLYARKIMDIKPDYTLPEFTKSSCFIATATMGTYNHPDVLTLRLFRDDILLETIGGRKFVSLYYKMSPPFADFIRKSEALKAIVRVVLIKPCVFLAKALLK